MKKSQPAGRGCGLRSNVRVWFPIGGCPLYFGMGPGYMTRPNRQIKVAPFCQRSYFLPETDSFIYR